MAGSDQRPKFSNISEFENSLKSTIIMSPPVDVDNPDNPDISNHEEELEENNTDILSIIDIDELHSLRRKFPNNALLGYLNINTLKNKIVDLRPLVQDYNFTFLAIAETKLNDSLKSAQFRIDGYYCPEEFRRDRTYNSGVVF